MRKNKEKKTNVNKFREATGAKKKNRIFFNKKLKENSKAE